MAIEMESPVTVWGEHQATTDFPEGTTVRFRTASGPVDVFLFEGKLRLTSQHSGNVGNPPALTIRPRAKHVLEIVPGL